MKKVKYYNLATFLFLAVLLLTVSADRSYAEEADGDIWHDEHQTERNEEKMRRRHHDGDGDERRGPEHRRGRRDGRGEMKEGTKEKPCPLGMESSRQGGSRRGESGRSTRGRRPEGGRGKSQGKGKEQAQKAFFKWLQKNYPEESAELRELRQKDGKAFTKRAALIRKKYGAIMEAEKKNPELAEILKGDIELKNRRNELLKEIKSTSGREREELTGELEDVVRERFELLIRKRQLRYESMLKRLEKLEQEVREKEAEIDKLRDKEDQAVEERIRALVGKTEEINWD